MKSAESDVTDEVMDLVAGAAKAVGRTVGVDDTWIGVRLESWECPLQGWKLHISARPSTLRETLERALPVLLNETCDFKVAKSAERLGELNTGDDDPATVGKALTIYPPEESVVRLGKALADALEGLSGPRIASDRRVSPNAPVYYRYGPFGARYQVNDSGDFELVVVGPDGERFPGAAGLSFSCPPWTTDPFRPDGAPMPVRVRLGGRYRVLAGVQRSSKGTVLKGEAPDGRRVVLKEARAFVGEGPDGSGFDLRTHVRNERRVLEALTGIDGVPGLLDHFRHGEDEYLVTTDGGDLDLNRSVTDLGLFFDDPEWAGATGRDLGALAASLARIVDEVHRRGVVVRDISPKNIVLDENSQCTLVDFGLSRYAGFQLPGYTPGYSPPEQRDDDREAEPAADYYAIGASLFFAATGMNPVQACADPVADRERTLRCLARIHPDPRPDGVVRLLPGLLSLVPEERSEAFALLRSGERRTGDSPGRAGGIPQRLRVAPDLLEAVVEHTLDRCLAFAEQTMDDPGRDTPPATNVYSGSAGLGMELLHHPRAAQAAADLARWTQRELPPAGLPNGLFFGRTGTALYLATARATAVPELTAPEPVAPGPDERGEYMHGLAGIGTGHLLLHRLAPDPRHLAIATECAHRIRTGDFLPTTDESPAQPDSGIVVETAFGHGTAGVASFLLALHTETGDESAAADARATFGELATETERLIGILTGPGARPMGTSWCQGMSGIASALLAAADGFPDTAERYRDLAIRGARACWALAPQHWVVSQCCGLAGIGETMLDVALATGKEEFWEAAHDIVGLMLIRSGGTYDRPDFITAMQKPTGRWGDGTSGVLSFLRRLHRREGARVWTPPSP